MKRPRDPNQRAVLTVALAKTKEAPTDPNLQPNRGRRTEMSCWREEPDDDER